MNKIRISAILIVVFASLIAYYYIYQAQITGANKFKLGLDLAGGTHLTYRADVSGLKSSDIGDSMDALRQTIERRINIFGVSEPIVQVETVGIFSSDQNDNRLIVELPGVTDVGEAIKQIGQTPVLEFRLEKEIDPALLNAENPENALNINDIFQSTGLTGAQLERSSLIFDPVTRQPIISLKFNSEGKDLFAKITSENVGRVMAIFLDGNMISNPVIRDSIVNGEAVINGDFTAEEAKELVKNLNFGALPVPIELIETQSIGPTLGTETLYSGIRSMIYSFALIFIFMIIYYRLPGIIASISLIIYGILMLAVFKFIPVTLTSSGLAGFILSIGMAVDANILIFERIKEELKRGSNLHDSIKDGSKYAWTSIRDGNLTSIISAVVLYWLSGTSVVKGFALVFGIGVMISMLTAVVVSKVFLLALSTKKHNSFYEKLFGCGFFDDNEKILTETELIRK